MGFHIWETYTATGGWREKERQLLGGRTKTVISGFVGGVKKLTGRRVFDVCCQSIDAGDYKIVTSREKLRLVKKDCKW